MKHTEISHFSHLGHLGNNQHRNSSSMFSESTLAIMGDDTWNTCDVIDGKTQSVSDTRWQTLFDHNKVNNYFLFRCTFDLFMKV